MNKKPPSCIVCGGKAEGRWLGYAVCAEDWFGLRAEWIRTHQELTENKPLDNSLKETK